MAVTPQTGHSNNGLVGLSFESAMLTDDIVEPHRGQRLVWGDALPAGPIDCSDICASLHKSQLKIPARGASSITL
jgi:hypothetical protein